MVAVFVRVTTYAATGRTYVHITVGNNVRIDTVIRTFRTHEPRSEETVPTSELT